MAMPKSIYHGEHTPALAGGARGVHRDFLKVFSVFSVHSVVKKP
jgi:hypothetical protein